MQKMFHEFVHTYPISMAWFSHNWNNIHYTILYLIAIILNFLIKIYYHIYYILLERDNIIDTKNQEVKKMLILATSKIQSNYQTTIPKEIRKNYDIDNETVVEWFINKNGNPEINFRKKRNFKNLAGAFKTDEKTNAVELKRGLYE